MLRRLRLVLDLSRKDWKLFVADRRAAVLCFAVPILLASTFGLIFDRPGQRLGACKLSLVVAVAGASPFAERVVADLKADPGVELREATEAEATRLIESRTCGVAVVFPPGFVPDPKGPRVKLLHTRSAPSKANGPRAC